ncbi:MAG: TauD/TfdA family dioxygenase, partial [Alphaproteobacteria bacterium]|nr:TauD/TfdA family dioxygenase [Alphaproteobacteria bacterium]
MPTILRDTITGPSAWKGAALQDDTTWLHRLTPAELEEIDAALRHAQEKELSHETITRDDFPLPGLAARLGEVVSQVRDGRGFFLLRGLPSEKYSEEEVFAIFWGIGMHCGAPVSQNSYGDLLGHVFDRGVKMGEGQ